MSLIKQYDKIAYGKPQDVKGAGKVINTGSRIGTKIVQLVYLRPSSYGYKIGSKK